MIQNNIFQLFLFIFLKILKIIFHNYFRKHFVKKAEVTKPIERI